MLLFKSNYVTDEIPVHTSGVSIYPYSPSLEAKYFFKTNFDEPVYGAIKQGNNLLVPRESVPPASPPNDYRKSYLVSAINCNFTPRNNQAGLVEKSVKLLLAGKNHIFESPPATGKTVMGSVIACKLGQPTLIVVTKQDLLEQWRDTLLNVLKVKPDLIGHIQQDTCDWGGKKFVLGMVHSLIIDGRYSEEMYRYFGLVIFDEVHLMAADCFVRACYLFPAKYRIGFSATPVRSDGKTKLLHWHIGPTLVRNEVVSLKPKVLVKYTGWRIPTRRKLVGNSIEQVPLPYSPGRMMLVTKAQASSPFRNEEIVSFTVQAYKAGRRVLILSDLKEYHLDRLFQLLCEKGIPGNEIGYYVGGMSKMELELSKVRRIVLGTMKMCSTGTDCPSWDTIIMATPRADIKQIVGRVLREKEGKKQPVVLDLVDFDKVFQNFHKSRLRQYQSIGAEVVKI